MANEYYGNAMPAPGVHQIGQVVPDREVLYSMHGYTQKGVTLKPGQGVLKAGTILVQDSASKQYVAAKDATSVTARGFLRQTVDTGSTADSHPMLGNVIEQGMVKLAVVTAANPDIEQASLDDAFPGARIDTTAGFLSF